MAAAVVAAAFAVVDDDDEGVEVSEEGEGFPDDSCRASSDEAGEGPWRASEGAVRGDRAAAVRGDPNAKEVPIRGERNHSEPSKEPDSSVPQPARRKGERSNGSRSICEFEFSHSFEFCTFISLYPPFAFLCRSTD